MAEPRSALETPLMRQYLEVKERYPDCVVFFRVGDFYEMFFDDAVTVARAIDLTLTSRDKGREDPTPMCGVPHHAARHYLAKLVERGFKVAICDQVEDPKLAKGIVRREVVRVVTPGVVLDDEQLEAKAGCYLVALCPDGAQVGLAYLDVSTGELGASELEAGAVDDELARLGARELLLPEGALASPGAARLPRSTAAPADPAADRRLVEEALGAPLGELGLGELPRAQAAVAACIRYARATQPTGTLPLSRVAVYRAADHLVLDEATQRNLEIFTTLDGKRAGSLLELVDETRTAMGGRLLRRWIGAPLAEVGRIRRRHDAVERLVERASLRAAVRGELAEVYDLERLQGRAALGVATPRDLAALRRSLEKLPPIARALEEAMRDGEGALGRPELLELGDDLGVDVAADVAAALVDDPPIAWRESGGAFRRGFSAELDELCDAADGGKEQILAIETRERERTGIQSLKVRYNRVFGYYLEITRSNLARVPADYVRKQTLANAERYVTPELAEHEARVLGAEERRLALEEQLFGELRARVAKAARRLALLAERVAQLDALAALAEVAHASGWTRPEVDSSLKLSIEEGRHPVVERLAAPGGFVPNDVELDPDDAQLVVITGPNMAGKSTVMRQVALIALLAQAGSFVPAKRARLGLVDRIFTRVGASDALARGDSTFMVEMRESAAILRHATRRSLIVLDEIGRGTSTYDGVSIAWAVAEHLHDRVGAKTMFATHYHELTELARSRPRVKNLHVAVREAGDGRGIVFLHRLLPGGASRSYGIEVARLAGLPRQVIERARQVLSSLEQADRGGPAPQQELPLFAHRAAGHGTAPAAPAAPTEEQRRAAQVVERLRAAEPDDLSPREAHQLLADLRRLL